MKLLDTIRTKLSGQTKQEFGFGQRFPLTKSMTQVIRRHFSELEKKDLSSYTFERRRSSYPDTKSDLIIYDSDSKPVLNGREASDGRVSFWPR
jgi:hypothetical protein